MGRIRRVFGNEGWEPLEYSQWTRYLVVRPLFVGGIGGLVGALAGIAAAASGASLSVTFAVVAAGIIAGLAAGGWLWLRRQNRSPQTPG